MRKYCCDCYWFIPTEPNKLQGKCVRHWAIVSGDLHWVIVSEDFHCDYHLNKNHMTWIKSSGSYFTPGGDPVWECPVCHDKHVYGIETPYGYSQCCEHCGNRMYYPWEKEDEGR